MKNRDWKLFQPITIKGLTLKNRIALLPMGNKLHSALGEVTPKLIDYYEEIAKGGAGLVIIQAAYVTDEFKGSRLRISSDDFVSGLNELAEAVKSRGARAAIQISHRGYLSTDRQTINDLDEPGIRKLIEAFGKAAERAKRAGFEMVEIHGAHGYLIPQFFSGMTNRRTDGYGGAFEKRMTLPLQVLRSVRKAVGDRFPVSFRMSGDEFLSGGISLDESKRLAANLEKEGVDLISLTAGKNPDTREWMIQPMAFPRGCLTSLSQEMKKAVRLPIVIAGRINEPVLANSILEEGKADLIGMGRGLIADPCLPKKALAGELDQIRKCIACNFCHGKRFVQDLTLKCAINPEAGMKKETASIAARKGRRMLVAGGGPSGLECAHSLQERGHEVLLFEKSEVLGGRLRAAAIPPHKEEIGEFLRFLVTRAKREKLPVFLNQGVNRSIVEDLRPDVLVLATGGKPILPSIPGLKPDCCYSAEEALTREIAGDRILILGGGLVGCEVAEYLASKGKKISIVEKLPDLGVDLEPLTRKLLLRRILERKPVIRTSTEIVRIEEGTALLRHEAGEERSVAFDALVFAMGFSPDHDLLNSIGPLSSADIHLIGDCLMPRGIFEAIHEGSRVARLF
jgi:2,4-dienoyl-CoA reductase-like NADH-dependent reductase (Old Yellow Enzyme family)/thioredoxin reductase